MCLNVIYCFTIETRGLMLIQKLAYVMSWSWQLVIFCDNHLSTWHVSLKRMTCHTSHLSFLKVISSVSCVWVWELWHEVLATSVNKSMCLTFPSAVSKTLFITIGILVQLVTRSFPQWQHRIMLYWTGQAHDILVSHKQSVPHWETPPIQGILSKSPTYNRSSA